MTSTGSQAPSGSGWKQILPGEKIIEEGKFPPGGGTQSGGFDWNPVSWFTTAADWSGQQVEHTVIWGGTELVRVAGWAGGVIAGVSKAIFHFVNVGLHVLENLTMRIVGVLHHMIAALFTELHKVEGLANGAVGWIAHSADWLSQHLDSWAKMFMHDVVQPAINAAIAGIKDAGHAATAVVHGLSHTVDWIQHTALPGLEHRVADLEHGAVHLADGAINTFNTDIVQPIAGKVEHLTTEVASLATEIPSDLTTILSDVTQAADWIAWFALHSFTDLEQLLTGWEGATVRAIEPGAGAFTQSERDLENLFKSLLG